MSVPSLRAFITGRVQGLGFRPYVFRLAAAFGVSGYVANTSRGVVVVARGRNARRLLDTIQKSPPPLAELTSCTITRVRSGGFRGFEIRGSAGEATGGVDVLPDLCLCRECRAEVQSPSERRYGYPFTNCTQCGPRYTIIESLPYDRPRTTMRRFQICPDCAREYRDPGDRRFHAQPIACPQCGPAITLRKPESRSPAAKAGSEIAAAARALVQGRIVAVKSLGGFQLACDATSDRAVARLRQRKKRPHKPLAVMADSLATVRRFCGVGRQVSALLRSAAAPIVLLPKLAKSSLPVSGLVAPSNPVFGVMLPYTPLHCLLLDAVRCESGRPVVLVMTSANRKDDPITITEPELESQLGRVTDLVLTHNRDIANRCDDSVVAAPLVMVRRARGYAPAPIDLSPMFHVKHPTLAVGAEYKNAFCLASRAKAYLSPHIGTLGTAAGEEFWLETLDRYRRWTGIAPERVVCDRHPNYASTRLAERFSRSQGLRLERVQHHHAHILSVMAEHGLGGPVLGLAFDGTGYGTDGAVWGCEFMLVDRGLSWQRLGHLGYLGYAGAGDEVADPVRVAQAYLAQARLRRSRSRQAGRPEEPGIPPRTSSLGRLFDAVAAITGVCRAATFDGQAAIALEAAADPCERGNWYTPALLDLAVSPAIIMPEPILLDVSRETMAGVSAGKVSARFHNTLARVAANLARELCRRHNLSTVCLSGGCFQNRRLRRAVSAGLRRLGLFVATGNWVPVNDGGVSLGQAVAASRVVPPSRRT